MDRLLPPGGGVIREMRALDPPRPFPEPPDGWADATAFRPDVRVWAAMDGPDREKIMEAKVAPAFVVTGQQPCFPLPLGLTLQKAATAVALAQYESVRLKRPVLPLFWNGADDSDFEEARGQYLPRRGGKALRVSLPSSLHRRGAIVGNLHVLEAWSALPRLRDLPWGPRQGEDLGSFQGRVLRELFPELRVLDARSPGIAKASLELYRRYADQRETYGAVLDAEGARLEAEGLDRPLRRRIGSRALWFLRGGRRVLPPEEDYGEALEGRLAEEPASLLPNVSLRPIVQDFILPVQGVVLGPSEWLYHHQLLPGFRRLDVPFPRPWPRLQADSGEEEHWGVPRGGREYSPLAGGPKVLGDPQRLLEAARIHLAEWSGKGYYRMILEDF